MRGEPIVSQPGLYDDRGFAVVDVETSGLSQWDRVIEIGLVLLDPQFRVQGEWQTLVWSKRVGSTEHHGLTREDLEDAPAFAEIADEFASLLHGRVFVAHNVSFDARMLRSEFERVGVDAGEFFNSSVCTMLVGRERFGCTGKLSDCLRMAGIAQSGAHHAMDDARHTAELLQFFASDRAARKILLRREYTLEDMVGVRQLGLARGARLARGEQLPEGAQRGWVARVASRVPASGDARVDKYRSVLAKALADGYVSRAEVRELSDVARSVGLDAAGVQAEHLRFFSQVALAAWEDGVLDADERARLLTVAQCLEVPARVRDRLLAEPVDVVSVARGGVWSPGEGSRVSFVGRLSQPAAAWDGRLEGLGLTRGALAKSTAVLVAADPAAPLATVAKARAAGIPVVDEANFVELLDVLEERQHSPAEGVDATEPVVEPEPVEPEAPDSSGPDPVEPAAAPDTETQEPEPAPEAQKLEPQQPPAQKPAAQIATPVQAVATPQQPAPYGVESKKSVSPAVGCGCATIALFVVVVVVLVLLMV